jgi:hypothetical protein
MSLQEYMRSELVRWAEQRTPSDIAIEVGQRLHREGAEGFSVVSSAEVIASDREAH